MTIKVCDSYSESNQNTTKQMDNSTFNPQYIGQSFTGDGRLLNKCTFYLQKSGTPAGTIVAKIYTHSGTYGTSSVPGSSGVAIATSGTITATNLSTSLALQDFTFTGANAIVLAPSVNYVVGLEYTAGTAVLVGIDTTSPTHGGNESEKTSVPPSSATATSGTDVCFYVYTDALPVMLNNFQFPTVGDGMWTGEKIF